MNNHPRVTKEGASLGQQLVRLTEPGLQILLNECEEDERCASCAFRLGTVPNGCPQTQMDALKAVMEQTPFACHMDPTHQKLCHGWYAARVALHRKGVPITKMPYDFSPPDVAEK